MSQSHPPERHRDPDPIRPSVALPPSGPPLQLTIAAIVLAGAGLFLVLNDKRQKVDRSASAPIVSQALLGADIPPFQLPPLPPPPLPPPLEPPTVAPPAPQAVRIQYVDRPGPAPPPEIRYVERPEQAPPPLPINASAPAMVIDLTRGVGATGEEGAAQASILRNQSTLVPQGATIAAVLETPVDSSRPGPVRALTTADTRGFDGTRVLIPRGSRLIGDVNATTQEGQRAVMVTWTRLIRPDGAAIRLNAPSSNQLGAGGIDGRVDNHIFARTANAVLQTAFVAGANYTSRTSGGSVIIGAPAQALSTVGQSIIPSPSRPTIKVRQGAEINVFVNRDLDFASVASRP